MLDALELLTSLLAFGVVTTSNQLAHLLRSLLQNVAVAALGLCLGAAASDGGETFGGAGLALLLSATAFLIQWAAWLPSFLARTERFYDLIGSVTYQAIAVAAVFATKTRDARTLMLTAMVFVWAIRLGTFLFRRVHQTGKDGRFDEIKNDWARFLLAWTTQGLWIVVTVSAALAAITSGHKQPIGVVGVIGALVWAAGFAVEVAADRQKASFRADRANEGRFITNGLWSLSRHPNYVGEFMLWTGVAIVSLPALYGWQHLTLISPIFVYALLTRISGIPILERRADQRWGDDPDYQAYKEATPIFLPF